MLAIVVIVMVGAVAVFLKSFSSTENRSDASDGSVMLNAGTPSSPAPTQFIWITSPITGSSVNRGDTIWLQVKIDEKEVDRVTFSVNGTPVCTARPATFECSWNVPTNTPVGNAIISAEMFDRGGKSLGLDKVDVTITPKR